MKNFIFLPIMIFVLVGNLLWYYIKYTLPKNGYKVSFWYGHMKDLPNFWKLIKSTENNEKKTRYSIMFWGFIICLVLFFGSIIFMFATNNLYI